MENAFDKWVKGLEKTRKTTFGRIANFLGASDISSETWERLEALFIQADLGVETTLDIIETLQDRVREIGLTRNEELLQEIEQELLSRLKSPPEEDWSEKPSVILIVGVNGSGKTTTMAKLGKRFQDQGKKVMFGASDTYRAAGADQLQVWGERLNIPVISGEKGGDPGAVAYDAIKSAIARQTDMVFIDTAGRLHTRYNLMEELKKVHRVAGKALPGAPHANWLVMDATTGQNALHQAEAFQNAIPLDGVILAKLDSSARGGMAFVIQKELDLPILYAGLGETADDIERFDPQAFVTSILADF
jgi:fused signal recognition particle receptor